jgi:hypothetical protein
MTTLSVGGQAKCATASSKPAVTGGDREFM